MLRVRVKYTTAFGKHAYGNYVSYNGSPGIPPPNRGIKVHPGPIHLMRTQQFQLQRSLATHPRAVYTVDMFCT